MDQPLKPLYPLEESLSRNKDDLDGAPLDIDGVPIRPKDMDGVPLKQIDIDGVPLSGDDIDGTPSKFLSACVSVRGHACMACKKMLIVGHIVTSLMYMYSSFVII